jgi:hypothetical protein
VVNYLFLLLQMISGFEKPSEHIETLSHYNRKKLLQNPHIPRRFAFADRQSRTDYPWSSMRGPWKLFRA